MTGAVTLPDGAAVLRQGPGVQVRDAPRTAPQRCWDAFLHKVDQGPSA